MAMHFGPMGKPPVDNKNKAKVKGVYKRLFSLLKPFKLQVIAIVIFVIFSVAFTILAPTFMYKYLQADYVVKMFTYSELGAITGINGWDFWLPFVLIGGSYIFANIFTFLSEFLSSKLSGTLGYLLRQQTKEKIDNLPLSYFDTNTYGEILSRVTNDTDTISSSVQQIITQVLKGVFQIVAVTVTMFVINWKLALVAVATLPLGLVIALTIAMRSQKKFVAQQRQIGLVNSHVEEMYSGFKIIKIFNKEEDVNVTFRKKSHDLSMSGRRAMFLSNMIQPLMIFVQNIGYVFICVLGGILGDVASIMSFFIYLQLFQQPVQQIAQIANVLQQTSAASQRVFEVLDEKEEERDIEGALDASNLKGMVDFKHVTFSYDPEVPLITDLNLHINPGDTVAIVGPTGAGKTTLVNLIMRFYDITGGELEIDGKPINSYKRTSLRKNIGMVLQDTWLFNGTIGENIAYGNMDASKEDIINAAKEAHAHHFIMTLPQGYDTILNEEASNISQGQRQLITIARAILSNPKIMILDEATSSVDTRTEKALQDAMDTIMSGRTSFIIAHRLSTIKSAKMILVMNHGNIIEQGNHKELMALGGFYADLYNAQFMGSKENEQ